MFIQSHLILAKTIAQGINNSKTARLKFIPFSLGAIYPDISPQYNGIPHTRESLLPILNDLSRSVLREDVSWDRQSFKLGIMCHFICDIFCQAHNFDLYQQKLRHFGYEMKMDLAILYYLRKAPFNLFIPEQHFSAAALITEPIIEIHDLYLNLPPSITTDLEFSIVCSQALLTNMFYGTQSQPFKQAA